MNIKDVKFITDTSSITLNNVNYIIEQNTPSLADEPNPAIENNSEDENQTIDIDDITEDIPADEADVADVPADEADVADVPADEADATTETQDETKKEIDDDVKAALDALNGEDMAKIKELEAVLDNIDDPKAKEEMQNEIARQKTELYTDILYDLSGSELEEFINEYGVENFKNDILVHLLRPSKTPLKIITLDIKNLEDQENKFDFDQFNKLKSIHNKLNNEISEDLQNKLGLNNEAILPKFGKWKLPQPGFWEKPGMPIWIRRNPGIYEISKREEIILDEKELY